MLSNVALSSVPLGPVEGAKIASPRMPSPAFATNKSAGPTDHRKGGLPQPWVLNPTGRGTCRETVIAICYGLINFVCILPVVVAFAHIVCADAEFFEPFFPYILKVVIMSSFVHQTVFCMYSGLVFAIGQVQDVGLIFLAAITKSVLARAKAENTNTSWSDREEIVATCLWACGVATMLCGVAVRAIGRKKLVDFVSLIPLPVVGVGRDNCWAAIPKQTHFILCP